MVLDYPVVDVCSSVNLFWIVGLVMIHTTIGIYGNGSYKTNGVPTKHLAGHIKYNTEYRCGRALIVDNKIIHSGNLSLEFIQTRLRCIGFIKEIIDTQPYH